MSCKLSFVINRYWLPKVNEEECFCHKSKSNRFALRAKTNIFVIWRGFIGFFLGLPFVPLRFQGQWYIQLITKCYNALQRSYKLFFILKNWIRSTILWAIYDTQVKVCWIFFINNLCKISLSHNEVLDSIPANFRWRVIVKSFVICWTSLVVHWACRILFCALCSITDDVLYSNPGYWVHES